MDYDKHIFHWKKKKHRKQQGKTKSAMLIFCFTFFAFEYCICLYFQFMIKSLHIYIPLYFCLLFVYLVLYMNRIEVLFYFLFWFSSLKSFPETIFRGKEGNWKLALPELMLSQGCFWSSWVTVDVNDNQSRELLLLCNDSIHLSYQGIGIILFFCLSLQKVMSLCQSHLLAGTSVMTQRSSQQSTLSHTN